MGSDHAEVQEEMLCTLHGAHAAELGRFVNRLTGDHAYAEDVTQETLFRAWQRPAILERPEAAVRAWLFTVARNLVVDDWRSARRRHEVGAESPPEQHQADATDRVLDSWLVTDALACLSLEHREVLVHGYYRALSVREISQTLDIPEGTVKSRMHYALRANEARTARERGDPMTDHNDSLAQWDAAYVLGALSPAERHEFEIHLSSCARCAASVAELAGMPGILAALPAAAQAEALLRSEAEPVQASANVLPMLARRARKSKVRRRLMTVAAGIAVAAAATTVTVVALPASPISQVQANAVPLNFSAIDAQPVTVSGKALPVSWGTQIEWRCSYAASQSTPGYTGGASTPFQLVVVDRNGKETVAASWDSSDGSVVSPVTTIDTPLTEISKIEVRWANSGKVVVSAKL
ncbi:sigma-70 family RNA polymerase sigma factor [Renibacterium salmoninarum]|nr:sigma-70 family RNA polymerase sigma factor [Renibacterium salmoninarum]